MRWKRESAGGRRSGGGQKERVGVISMAGANDNKRDSDAGHEPSQSSAERVSVSLVCREQLHVAVIHCYKR